MERAQLFCGKPVVEVERQYKEDIKSASDTVEDARKKLEDLEKTITAKKTQQESYKTDLQNLSQEIKELNSSISQWLNNFNDEKGHNLSKEELESILDLPSGWIDSERKALKEINDKLLSASTILKKQSEELENHKNQNLSDKTMEVVSELLNTVREALNESTQEETEINLRLKQNEENRQKAGTLLNRIEAQQKVVDNWGQLNLVIGSADGKKFRQVAQGYTLDVLLGYANVQLDMLSKRYVLERTPDSLGLQVIDRDMGDEVRTVNSLSGGESFLVSLALALGLASLSSSRMQVESLFIDEGFGSLDPNTLNVAMDALERLHNQGRKVGVISHVHEMTERIPAQIKVKKQQNGRSTVSVE
jgi:exonuclease SbcC